MPFTWRLLSLRWTNEHITGRKSLMTATLAIIAGKTPFYVSHQDIICHFQFTKNSTTHRFFSSRSRERMNEKASRPCFILFPKMRSELHSLLCLFFTEPWFSAFQHYQSWVNNIPKMQALLLLYLVILIGFLKKGIENFL